MTLAALCAAILVGCAAAYTMHGRAATPAIAVTGPAGTSDALGPTGPVPTASPPSRQAPATESPAPPSTLDVPPLTEADKPAPPTAPETLAVHVAGAVKNPGLYQLPPGSRVANAIHAAGGARVTADLDTVNLAEKVQDGEKVYLPTKSEHGTPSAPPGNAIGHRGAAGGADSQDRSSEEPGSLAAESGSSGTAHADKISQGSRERVNINTASLEELQRLPGIGPAMAQRVLDYRRQSGGFSSVDQLREVKGIGEKKFAKIAPLVTLR